MRIILLSNMWYIIELLFRNNFHELRSIPDFKIMSTLNQKNKLDSVAFAIPYWTLFANEDYIEYIMYMNIANRPYYDSDIESFIFKNTEDMLTQINTILQHLKQICVEDEDLKYKAFVIDIIMKQSTITCNYPENNLDFMMKNLKV